MKLTITQDKQTLNWMWVYRDNRKVIAGGWGKTRKDAKNDAEIWLKGRKSP